MGGQVVFCNPPYGRRTKDNPGQENWIEKCWEECKEHHITSVMLIPARTDTRSQHTYIFPNAKYVTYDESILDEYIGKYNLMFFKDGISFQTQEHFNVGFDLESLRITVPEYTLDGKLCGIMGRLNDSKCSKDERWLPIIPCSRSLTLYGYHHNYESIQQKNIVVVGESEKFVQQLHSMGSYIGLATCGCDVSDIQAKHLKALMTSKIILAYDEGLEEEQIRLQAQKLILNNAVFQNHVGFMCKPLRLWDKDWIKELRNNFWINCNYRPKQLVLR